MTSFKFHEYLIKLIKVISVKTTALSAPFKDWKALKKKREFQNLEFRLKPLYSRNISPHCESVLHFHIPCMHIICSKAEIIDP